MSCVAAIYSLGGKLAGSGTIISENRILTCAHVVNAGLVRKLNATERPHAGDRVAIRFSGAPGQLRFAEVAPDAFAWSPPPANRAVGADLCMLSLSETIPVGASAGRISRSGLRAGVSAIASGYPGDWNEHKDQPQLDIAQAVILGRDGYLWLMRADQGAWIATLNENKRSAGLIYGGFSGGPVQVDDSILGLIVEARQKVKEATAYLIPAYAFPAEIFELQRTSRPGGSRRRELEVTYDSGPIILNKEHLCTLSIFYDRIMLPYVGERDTFIEFTRPKGSKGSYKLAGVSFMHLVTNLGNEFSEFLSPSDDLKKFIADEIPNRWDQAYTELFQAGALARLGPPEDQVDYDEVFKSPEAFESVAARFKILDLVLSSTWDGRSWSGNQEEKNVGPHDVLYLPTSHVHHLLRTDLRSPGIFLPRNRRWREISKAIMAHAAITYLLPKLSSIPLPEVLRIRGEVSDTREGFSMYLQELTAQVDEAIKSGENFEDVTRYSETVVEARLIPAYREYKRQIEDVSIAGDHVTSGAVEVSAALPDERVTNGILRALGMSDVSAVVNRAARLTNRSQAFQFMQEIERGQFRVRTHIAY
jgi:hypothetical protein